jgi:pyruvate decarboxylase
MLSTLAKYTRAFLSFLLQVLFKHIQALLQPSTLLLAETGDSVFNCQKLRLPDGCQ